NNEKRINLILVKKNDLIITPSGRCRSGEGDELVEYLVDTPTQDISQVDIESSEANISIEGLQMFLAVSIVYSTGRRNQSQ
ncbi:42877_t:CDS:2, partial [Gigaspora margarita]